MKNFYIFFSFMVVVMTISSSKTGRSQSSDNYYIIRDSLESYYNSHPDLKQEEDGEYAQFIRWEEFWRDRVYGSNQGENGSLKLFGKAVKEYLDKFDYYHRSTIIGSDWHCLGPDYISNFLFRGKVMSVYVDTAADRNMNTIYIGTEASGIWKTTDGGLNWHNVTDPSGIPLLGIRDIAGDPYNGNIIYGATGFYCMDPSHDGGIGIIKSSDGGVTWRQLLTFDQVADHVVYRILVDPFNSQRIYALVDNHLLRNNFDGIGNWDTIFTCPDVPNGGERRNLRSIQMKPGDNSTLYVASEDRVQVGAGHMQAKVYKIKNATNPDISKIDSVNLDQQFASPNTVLTQRYQIAICPADTSALYIGCQQFILQGNSYKSYFIVWKYDRVNLWKKKITISEDTNDGFSGTGFDKISLLVSPSDTSVVYVGGYFMNKLLNWKWVSCGSSANIHADIRDARIFQIVPADSGKNDILFTGHDGGISKAIGDITNWNNLNGNGLVITEFNGIGGANKRPNKIYGGTQDDEMISYSNGTWFHSQFGGDNGNPCVDYDNPDTGFITCLGGNRVLRSTDGFNSVKLSGNYNISEPYAYYIPIVINPQNHKSVYFGYHNLWKSVQAGDSGTFTKILIPPAYCSNCNDGIKAFCIAPTDTNTIYVAYDGPICSGCQPVKLIRRSIINNVITWADLTQNITPLINYYGITAMEVSPTDSKKLWITFGGYWHQNDPAHHRVLLSTDGGDTWNLDSLKYSKGLPNSPINCIKYMKGIDDRLFLCTDGGVFYRDKYCTEWQPFNTGLPTCIVTDLEINDNTQKIRAGTFGRGLYETDLSCDYNDTVWEIHSNITLNHDTALTQSILIDSSYTLTVKARLKLPPMARIFVQPGAKLIVDSGTLTNRCYNMWRGIEVRGHDLLKQNILNQGYVNFKNGAVLENARIGVFTVGGFIIAENSTFRNNYNAIKFEGYAFNQASRFTKVTFETTRNYLDTNYAVPQDFVSLCDVAGVRFTGCTFKNTTVPPGEIPGSLKGRGIYSMNATYYVDQHEYCPVPISPCPNPIYTPTEFKGLYYGIRVYNSDPARYVQINNSIFDHNYRGIYLGSSNYSTLTQNKFLIPNNIQTGADTCYGLYLGTCSGYHVEDNNFSDPGNSLSSGSPLREIGLIVDNSGGAPNEIYKNYFDTLDIAINAQRVNRQDGGAITLDLGGIVPYPIAIPTGLVLKCNTYNNNIYDEMATKGYLYGLEGIAKNQGANTGYGKDQAGNTFSPYHEQAQIPESDIKNVADNIIYYHQIPLSGLRVRPDYHTTEPKVVLQPVQNTFNYDTCCPSKLASPNPTPLDLRDVLSQEGTLINSLVNQLKNLVDNGNTDEMNDNIIYSAPPDALDVRQDLLNGSPYLSDSVMKSAIEKESVLPNEMIRDVLVANPQSAKTDDVLNTLNDRFIPMPDSMMAEIMDGKDQLSPKEELEAQIALHAQNFMDAYHELVRYYLTDSIASESPDSIIDFLETISDLDGKYLLASEYLSIGDTTNMDNTLNSISQIFTLDRPRQQQYYDYLTYFTFLKSLQAQNRDILHIDSTQIAQLVTLYNQTSEPVASYVRNILITNNVINYFEPIIIPDDLKSTPEKNVLRTGHFSEGCYLKLFPNPAKHYIIAEYNAQKLSSENNEILLTITSSDGKILETRILSKPQDQQLIKTVDYKPGIYLCILKSGNKVLASRKFTIIQ